MQRREGDPRRPLPLFYLPLQFGWVAVGPWAVAVAAAAAARGSAWAAAFVVAVLALTLDPLPSYSPRFRHHPAFDTWRRYHRVRLLTPALPYLLDAERAAGGDGGGADGRPPPHLPSPAVIAHYPHGVFPTGSFLSAPLCGDPATGLPSDTVAAVASVLLRLPVVRQVLAAYGCVPATRGALEAALARGASVGVLPEGVAGVFARATPTVERVQTRHRGYIKLALRSAATQILPVLVLGQSRALTFAGSARLSRALRASVGVWWGRWGLPCLPRPVDVVLIVCPPVRVGTIAAPTQADVDGVFERVADRLRAAFAAHAAAVPGYAGTRLEFVDAEGRVTE